MKRLLLLCALLLLPGAILSAQPRPRVWSETTARQFIHRYADPDEIRWGDQNNSFTWQAGYLMFAMEHLWRWSGDPACLAYIRKYVDQNVDEQGRVRQFRPDALDIDLADVWAEAVLWVFSSVTTETATVEEDPRIAPFLSAVSSAFSVFLPARPSAARLFSCWKRRTALSVLLPKIPSAFPVR